MNYQQLSLFNEENMVDEAFQLLISAARQHAISGGLEDPCDAEVLWLTHSLIEGMLEGLEDTFLTMFGEDIREFVA